MAPHTDPTAQETPPRRHTTIDALRGVAALAVAWLHFTNGHPTFPATDWLRASGTWGWLGVMVFFVISGFVLPLTMYRAGYEWRDAGRFLTRRIVRLHPAYLASLALTLALVWVSSLRPGFDRPLPGPGSIVLHLAYLPPFFGYDWINTIYWTLGIEIQFYLLLAVVLPLLIHPTPAIRLATIGGAAALSFLDPTEFLVGRYLVLFAMGTTTFEVASGLLARSTGVAVLTGLALAAGFVHGLPAAAVAAGTAALIGLETRAVWPPLASLGAFSYSFYLIHGPVGGRVMNLGARYAEGTAAELFVAISATLVSLAGAYVLYRVVEQPSLRLAARLKRRPARAKADPAYALP